jgi:hypothetical protein
MAIPASVSSATQESSNRCKNCGGLSGVEAGRVRVVLLDQADPDVAHRMCIRQAAIGRRLA